MTPNVRCVPNTQFPSLKSKLSTMLKLSLPPVKEIDTILASASEDREPAEGGEIS